MRILFVARRFSYLKNFEGPILELARRGHTLHLVALAGEGKLEGTALVQRWAEQEPRITFDRLSPSAEGGKTSLRARVSMMVDYLRYLDEAYRKAPGLVERARFRTATGFLELLERPLMRRRSLRAALRRALQRLEAATPTRPELDAFLRAQQPDIVLFTPLIALQSEEQDLLTAAVEQRLRTVFCVLSWDNLSSKAMIRTMPDLVMVWNDVQREEARRLHRVPDDRIAATGAQTFDHWFDRRPSRSRADFLARVGLPPDRPFLLWVCSALFRTSPMEAGFVRNWIAALRSAPDPQLRDVSVLVRPHPARVQEWAKVSLDDLGAVSLWGANPVDIESRNDYFDSLYYSEAVAGLNTSAFLEAAIVGRPVCTILLPEFHASQEGTLHFPYLLNVAGGLVHVARDMDAHLADLARAIRQPGAMAERSRRFVQAFIRPHGLDVNATQRFVGEIEDLLGRPPKPAIGVKPAGFVLRRLYAWLDARSRRGRLKSWLTTSYELAYEAKVARREEAARACKDAGAEQKRLRRQVRADRHEAKQLAQAERLRRHQAKEAERAERIRMKQEALQRHRATKQPKAPQETHQ